MFLTQERQKNIEFWLKMPQKSRANRARAANLHRDKKFPSQPTTIAYSSWTWTLASIGNSSRSVRRIQMWIQPNKLLLSSSVVQSTRFRQPEVTTRGTHNFAWPYLWFLSQISLWIEFYWTILGCSQISLPQLSQQANNNWRDGKPGAGMLRQHPSPSNLAVSGLFFHFHREDNHILN